MPTPARRCSAPPTAGASSRTAARRCAATCGGCGLAACGPPGGPGIASTPLNLQIYNTGLEYQQVGYAASMGVVLILMIAISVGVVYLIAGRGSLGRRS